MTWRLACTSLLVLVVAALAAPSFAGAACVTRGPEPPPRLIAEPPPRDLVERMAVLRRASTPEDRLPDLMTLNGFLTINADYVRLLASGPEGERYYLVPGSPRPYILPARCRRNLSPQQRRLLERRDRTARRLASEVFLSVHGVSPGGGGAWGRTDLAALLSNRTLGSSEHRRLGEPISSTLLGLVPDGVASVTLAYPKVLTRKVAVTDNFWFSRVPFTAPQAFPGTTQWRGADGRILKVFREGGRWRRQTRPLPASALPPVVSVGQPMQPEAVEMPTGGAMELRSSRSQSPDFDPQLATVVFRRGGHLCSVTAPAATLTDEMTLSRAGCVLPRTLRDVRFVVRTARPKAGGTLLYGFADPRQIRWLVLERGPGAALKITPSRSGAFFVAYPGRFPRGAEWALRAALRRGARTREEPFYSRGTQVRLPPVRGD